MTRKIFRSILLVAGVVLAAGGGPPAPPPPLPVQLLRRCAGAAITG